MEKINIDNYDIEIEFGYDFDLLKERWLSIQSREDVPFFLTWSWISCWLSTYQPSLIVVTAHYNNHVVAIGLFTRSIQKRRGFITSAQIRLHQMGEPLKDQIWMEYNDFISLSMHREAAVNACLKALESDSQWDEIILTMMSAHRATEVAKANPQAVLDLYRPCYAVDLNTIRLTDRNYLDFLTSNTRYQVTRSMRLYQKKYSEVELQVASTREEALEFFREAAPLHILRWEDSGYHNDQFVRFHENLITDSFDEGAIALLKVKAGNEIIAIMYYHINHKSVYFYLHGLKYEKNSKLKPGLVAHTLATQYFIDQGMNGYDYMGGYSQYKEQLADLSEKLVTVVIQRPRSRFRIENMARDIKRRIISAPD